MPGAVRRGNQRPNCVQSFIAPERGRVVRRCTSRARPRRDSRVTADRRKIVGGADRVVAGAVVSRASLRVSVV